MFKDGEQAKVGYPTEGFDGDVAGRSFHNGRFVQRLREAAASVPSVTLRQGIAKRLLNGETTVDACRTRRQGNGQGLRVRLMCSLGRAPLWYMHKALPMQH